VTIRNRCETSFSPIREFLKEKRIVPLVNRSAKTHLSPFFSSDSDKNRNGFTFPNAPCLSVHLPLQLRSTLLILEPVTNHVDDKANTKC
jgi:hypothetical protein